VTHFRLKHLPLDTMREHVIVIHARAVRTGNLGLHPLDRACVFGIDRRTGIRREITGVLNVCSDDLLDAGGSRETGPREDETGALQGAASRIVGAKRRTLRSPKGAGVE